MDCQVTLFRNKINLLDATYSLNDGRLRANIFPCGPYLLRLRRNLENSPSK